MATLYAVAEPGTAKKKPWEWTVEERIAARTDADAALERVRAGRKRSIAENTKPAPEWRVDDIDGKVNPELFLPHEVFRTLISVSCNTEPRTRDGFRRALQRKVDQHGLPADFWVKLEAIATIYAADMRAALEIGEAQLGLKGEAHERAGQALELKHADVCRSRAAALEAAYKEFGTDRFNRFLYTEIAPNMFSTVTETLPPAELLRMAAEGCR